MSNLNQALIYIIFFSFGLKYSFYEGFYAHDLLIIAYILVNLSKITINFQVLIIILFLSSLSSFFVALSSYKIDSIHNLIQSFYLAYNLFIFILYLVFFGSIKTYFNRLNYNIVLLFLSMPIIISSIMFFCENFEAFMHEFYGIRGYPLPTRYAGVFGADVNSFGFYSSLLLLFAILLYRSYSISFLLFFLVFFLCVFGIILSGMRMGIFTILLLILLFQIKLKLIRYDLLLYIIVYVVLSVVILYLTNNLYILEEVYKRYSLNRILEDLDPNADGNLSVAINHFKSIIENEEISLQNIFIGINPYINFVDNLYVFLIIKYGFVFTSMTLIIVFIVFFASIIQKNYFLFFILALSVLISIKGIFILSNYFLFLATFMVFLYRRFQKYFY